MLNPNVEALIQQARIVEQLVEVLGMGIAAGKESPAMLCMIWALLTLAEGRFEVVSEAAAANLVQLLYTGACPPPLSRVDSLNPLYERFRLDVLSTPSADVLALAPRDAALVPEI
eukprot:1194847-Prorocentrum_minimum.AAC.5